MEKNTQQDSRKEFKKRIKKKDWITYYFCQGGLKKYFHGNSLYNELKHQLARYKQENEELYAEISRKESELESKYSKMAESFFWLQY